tara:strand:+ start:772 stop:1164 length:393 start_codon:yes stop_codon:yes gene_type:complete
MTLYDNLPIYCFVNSSKFKVDSVKNQIYRDRQILSKKLEDSSEHGRHEEKSEISIFTDLPRVLSDMDAMLSGQREDELQKILCTSNGRVQLLFGFEPCSNRFHMLSERNILLVKCLFFGACIGVVCSKYF